MHSVIRPTTMTALILGGALALGSSNVSAQEEGGCEAIATALGTTVHSALEQALVDAVEEVTVGLDNQMWGTIVGNTGIVCAVAHTGEATFGDQWLGSRVISAQKANTGNAFSLTEGLALSSANLYSLAQPGGSLFGLQFSNPVDPRVGYGDNTDSSGGDSNAVPSYGASNDPMVETYIGGINVFGGGFALYDENQNLLGGLGVSGDTSCADHIIGWITRDNLALDNVPAGVADGTDNIIFDIVGSSGNFQSKSGFGHPTCGFGEEAVAEALPTSHPIGAP